MATPWLPRGYSVGAPPRTWTVAATPRLRVGSSTAVRRAKASLGRVGLALDSAVALRLVPMGYPARGRGGAATRPHGLCSSRPRCRHRGRGRCGDGSGGLDFRQNFDRMFRNTPAPQRTKTTHLEGLVPARRGALAAGKPDGAKKSKRSGAASACGVMAVSRRGRGPCARSSRRDASRRVRRCTPPSRNLPRPASRRGVASAARVAAWRAAARALRRARLRLQKLKLAWLVLRDARFEHATP